MDDFDPIDDETINGLFWFIFWYCAAILSIVGGIAVLVYNLVF